jgi:hypothetical protein
VKIHDPLQLQGVRYVVALQVVIDLGLRWNHEPEDKSYERKHTQQANSHGVVPGMRSAWSSEMEPSARLG